MRKLLFVLAAAGLLAVAAPAAGAGPALPELPPQVEEALPEYARAGGITVEQARRNLFIRDAARPTLREFRGNPNFAGYRFHPEDGSYSVFSTLSDEAAQAAIGRVPGVTLRFKQVAYNRAQLDAAVNDGLLWIFDAYPGRVESLVADYGNGALIVEGAADLPIEEIQTRIGTIPVSLEVTELHQQNACYTRDSCKPWRGGIKLQRNNDGWVCTLGFWADRNGNKVLLTAGHCGDNATFKHHGVTIGTEARNSLYDATYYYGGQLRAESDSIRIDVGAADEDEANNWIYKSGAQMSYSLNDQLIGADYNQGDTICLVGAAASPALRCTQVENENQPVSVDRNDDGIGDVVVPSMVKLSGDDFESFGGDSGGPWYGLTSTGVEFAGIHHGGTSGANGYGLFSKVGKVQNDLVVVMCETYNCQ